MKIIYYSDYQNFGDALNEPLADRVFGDIFNHDPSQRFLFVGTIIDRRPPTGTKEIILGAGAGYKRGKYSIVDREIFCVRGPLTCDILGISRNKSAIDPAILCSRYFLQGHSIEKQPRTTFIPHFSTDIAAGSILREACSELQWSYLSPLEPVETVINQISKSDKIVTEALHGAILAESYNKPWAPVIIGSLVMEIKWNDFCDTIGIKYNPKEINTNIEFGEKVKYINKLKNYMYKAGVGKIKYKYLPIMNRKDNEVEAFYKEFLQLEQEGRFFSGNPSVKENSISRLDEAIYHFKQVHG